ncbi:unnamed protein product [Symbiodinium natans]|uniref:Uncharacterized protein n=1 Tax=Symbiodinium natans TaxID=878477 RepID=A0A812TS88_9DINO|nr:unnamed protein product [Symbiodinium natans]
MISEEDQHAELQRQRVCGGQSNGGGEVHVLLFASQISCGILRTRRQITLRDCWPSCRAPQSEDLAGGEKVRGMTKVSCVQCCVQRQHELETQTQLTVQFPRISPRPDLSRLDGEDLALAPGRSLLIPKSYTCD